MRTALNIIGLAFKRLFATRRPELSRSRLMGMYLHQANGRSIYSSDLQKTRSRRNGKYSTVRRRHNVY